MKKNVNLCIDLKTLMQEDVILCAGQCYRGLLTRTGDHQFLFEECVPAVRHYHRHPKLYDGRYVNLVRKPNGRYQVRMRDIDASAVADSHELAQRIYMELQEALSVME